MERCRFDGPEDLWSMQSLQIIQENYNMIQPFSSPGFPGISRLDSIQSQEPMKEAGFGNVAEKTGVYPVHSEALINGALYSPFILNRDFISSSLDEIRIPDFDIGNEINGSLESLDCLLSATNSNTDNASVEDDGISMTLSDYCSKSFHKIGVSSGGSACFMSSNNDLDSHSSDDLHQKSLDIRKGGKKRSHDELLMKPGENNLAKFALVYTDSSGSELGFQLYQENQQNTNKNARLDDNKQHLSSSNINFQQPSSMSSSLSMEHENDSEAITQMKEMIYRAAAFRPVDLGIEVVEKPRRKNVRISSDPQTVAARERREKISERISVLQKLVPGGSKMDTASMLDEAANYLKFLRSQVKQLEAFGNKTCNNNFVPLSSGLQLFSHNSIPCNIKSLDKNPSPVLHPRN